MNWLIRLLTLAAAIFCALMGIIEQKAADIAVRSAQFSVTQGALTGTPDHVVEGQIAVFLFFVAGVLILAAIFWPAPKKSWAEMLRTR